jgi:BMFP domain-containing protein YqiC
MPTRDMQLLQARLDSLDARIAQLEHEMAHADPKLHETYQAQWQEATETRRHAGDLMAQLKLQEAESWERMDLWNGIEAVFDDLGKFLDRITGTKLPPPQ